ncbi:hypothetical protein NE399_32625 [Streptomyces sp. Isolate_219]|nr:hypothetical protein [Streptomyces sp. Isolate_219]MCR8578789.1 hypothetical protein [Streptomyces sp. Isolate_219]
MGQSSSNPILGVYVARLLVMAAVVGGLPCSRLTDVAPCRFHRPRSDCRLGYYLRRTSHGTILSALVHAWVLTLVHRPDTWTYC